MTETQLTILELAIGVREVKRLHLRRRNLADVLAEYPAMWRDQLPDHVQKRVRRFQQALDAINTVLELDR